MTTILIVGAGGFIGGHIAQQALALGWDTYVGVRATTSRRYLTDARLHVVEFDYDNPQAVEQALRDNAPAGGWKYIIYNLGATKCANFADFNKINYLYLKTFVDALRQTQLVPERFLFMSSLSALGPGDEKGYTPLRGTDIPVPNTRYGTSKIKAETYLQTLSGFPWIIFRPTGVYGPHEQDYLMMINCIDHRVDFGVGYRRQLLTFIYVDDLVAAMFQALQAPADKVVGHKYIIAEGRAYTQKEFRKIVAEQLGKKFVIPIRVPLWGLYGVSVVAEKWGLLTMKPSTLNRDKYRIMRQRNWDADISEAQRDFGFAPRFDLRAGIAATVEAMRNDKKQKNN